MTLSMERCTFRRITLPAQLGVEQGGCRWMLTQCRILLSESPGSAPLMGIAIPKVPNCTWLHIRIQSVPLLLFLGQPACLLSNYSAMLQPSPVDGDQYVKVYKADAQLAR